MTIILQHRRGTTAESNALTGAEGELFVDLDKNTVVVHDGVTQGGYALPTFNDIGGTTIDSYARTTANGATTLAQSAYNYANTIVSDTQIDPYARTTANGANGLAAGAFAAANTKFNSSGGTISGNVTIQGALNVTDNTIVSKNVEANIIIVDTTLYSGLASRSSIALPNLIAQFASNSNTYIQVNAQNIDPQGSADYVITADNGSDTDYYIDMGMLGSQYNNQYAYNGLGTAGTPYDGYLYVQGSTIGQLGGNLIIGTTSTTPGQDLKFIVGGSNTEHIVARVTHDGLIVNGTISASGGITGSIDSYARTTANTATSNITIMQGVNSTQNTNITVASNLAQSAFNQANTSAQTIPQNSQSSNYTLQGSDAGKHIYSTTSGTQTINLPNNGTVSWGIGSTVMLVLQGSGTMNVIPATGVTMYLANNSSSKAYANVYSYGMATLLNVGANTWFINGAGVS